MKRNMDQIFAAITAAARDTKGRTLAQIDRSGDEATSEARKLVAITLEEYAPCDDTDPRQAANLIRVRLPFHSSCCGNICARGTLYKSPRRVRNA